MSQHLVDIVNRDDIKTFNDAEMRDLVTKLERFDDFNPFNFTPPGPVAQEFILSPLTTAFLMGPLGGGKTTACAFKRIYAATLAPIAWHPETRKPTRMCRWIVLRDTFRSAEKTVLESWKQWFPKTYPGSSWTGGNDRPAIHTLRFMGEDGITIEVVTEFAGLGENSIETLMKGREYSGAWLNEADTHAAGALDDAEQRVGRYPSAKLLLSEDELLELERVMGRKLVNGRRRAQVIGDLNAPTLDNHVYEKFIKKQTPDRHLFRQPSGRSPQAENRFNLEPDYYDKIIRNQEEHFIKRMVDNEFGYSRHGKPVYESFRRDRHVARSKLIVNARQQLGIGIDTSMHSLSPAAVFGQVHNPGRLAVLRELYMGHGVGVGRFGEGIKNVLNEHFPNVGGIRIWIDPAAEYGADKEGGQLTAIEMLSVILGLPILIPFNGSNELGMRLDGVKTELRGFLEADTHLTICPEGCPLLIEGFDGKYRYKKRPEHASNEYDETPEKKHPWSDVHDGLQYLVGGLRGRTAIIRAAGDGNRREERRSSPRGERSSPWGQGSFDPHGTGW